MLMWWSSLNTSEFIFIFLILVAASTELQWSLSSAPIADWGSIASSKSGHYLLALSYSYGLFVSNDYGSTWTNSSSPSGSGESWKFVAVSSSAQYMVAIVYDGGIFISSDFGSSWNLSSAPIGLQWNGITISATGQYLAAVVFDGFIYQSSDYGSEWSRADAPFNDWLPIVSSSSGELMAVLDYYGSVYLSTDYGTTWSLSSAPSYDWTWIVSSSSGQFLAATPEDDDSSVYFSSDQGSTWSTSATTQPLGWGEIASSSSGQYLASIIGGGGISLSSDYGDTWNQSTAPVAPWNGIASSGDGQFLVATVSGGGIYIYNQTSSPSSAPSIFPTVLPSSAPLSPTSPSTSSSASPTSDLSNSFIVDFPVALGAFVVAWVWVALGVRARVEDGQLVKTGWDQFFLMAFKGVNVIVALTALARAEGTFLNLLVISRVVIAVAWLIALLAMFDLCGINKCFNNGVRLMAAAREDEFSSMYGIVYAILIVLALLDLSLLRLLPWARGKHTDMLRGYPNVFMVRLVLYGSLTASVFQLAASAVNVASSSDVVLRSLFLVVSFMYTASFFFDVALFMQYATSDQLKATVLTEEELKALRNGRDLAQLDTNVPHAEANLEVLRNQLKSIGHNPLQFIPLEDIRKEVTEIIAMMADGRGTPQQEERLEYLLQCLDVNKDYKREQEEDARRWREEVRGYCEECLQTMRGFVPKDIFVMSKEELAAAGLSRALVSRVWSKKCLWLIRMSDEAILKTHISDLIQKYNPQGAGLDIVEMAAIFARMPIKFTIDDGSARKGQWLSVLQLRLKQLIKEEKERVLSASLQRHPAYLNQKPVFGHDLGVHEAAEAVSSEGAFAQRDSFRNLGAKTTRNDSTDVDSERGSFKSHLKSLQSQITTKLFSTAPNPSPPSSTFEGVELGTGDDTFGNPQDRSEFISSLNAKIRTRSVEVEGVNPVWSDRIDSNQQTSSAIPPSFEGAII